MKDIDNLCMNCFKELTEGAVCTECGYDNDTPNDTMYLAPKTLLKNQYAVGAVIAHESDAVTYAGYDTQIDKKILIREFYPKGMANRLDDSDAVHFRQKYAASIEKYKKSFTDLWTTLEKMHSLSAVVPVYDVFEENETAYAIIEYVESIPLREYLLRNNNGYITWDTARLMFMPVLTTIETLHANGIVHGSITPDNLVLCRDGKVKLSPFCIQETADITSDFEFNVNDGYTALEQYDNNHKIGPSTDIYGFSACIYRALVGTNPPAATSRETNDKLMIPNSIAEHIPMHVIKAMGSGLQVYPEKRIKDIGHFRELLDAAPSVKAQSPQFETTYHKNASKYDYAQQQREFEKRTKRNHAAVIVLIILIVLAIGAGIYIVKFTNLLNNNAETTTATTQAVTYQVPNFVGSGYTQSDIENNGAWNNQFSITFDADYSTDVEEGIIFKQSIAAGETVNQGEEIVLTVSKGIQTQEIPDISSMTLEEATKTLEDLGFKVTAVEVYNDGSYTPNSIKKSYATAPKSGEQVAVGEEIIVQYYGEVQTTTTQADNND